MRWSGGEESQHNQDEGWRRFPIRYLTAYNDKEADFWSPQKREEKEEKEKKKDTARTKAQKQNGIFLIFSKALLFSSGVGGRRSNFIARYAYPTYNRSPSRDISLIVSPDARHSLVCYATRFWEERLEGLFSGACRHERSTKSGWGEGSHNAFSFLFFFLPFFLPS